MGFRGQTKPKSSGGATIGGKKSKKQAHSRGNTIASVPAGGGAMLRLESPAPTKRPKQPRQPTPVVQQVARRPGQRRVAAGPPIQSPVTGAPTPQQIAAPTRAVTPSTSSLPKVKVPPAILQQQAQPAAQPSAPAQPPRPVQTNSLVGLPLRVVAISVDGSVRPMQLAGTALMHGQVFAPAGLDEHGQPLFQLRPEAAVAAEHTVSVTVANDGPAARVALLAFDGDQLRVASAEVGAGVQVTLTVRGEVDGHVELGYEATQQPPVAAE